MRNSASRWLLFYEDEYITIHGPLSVKNMVSRNKINA